MMTGPKLTPHEKLEQAAWKLSGGEWSPEYQVITDMAIQLKNQVSSIKAVPVFVNGFWLDNATDITFTVEGYSRRLDIYTKEYE